MDLPTTIMQVNHHMHNGIGIEMNRTPPIHRTRKSPLPPRILTSDVCRACQLILRTDGTIPILLCSIGPTPPKYPTNLICEVIVVGRYRSCLIGMFRDER